jgi:hypothetical protein
MQSMLELFPFGKKIDLASFLAIPQLLFISPQHTLFIDILPLDNFVNGVVADM